MAVLLLFRQNVRFRFSGQQLLSAGLAPTCSDSVRRVADDRMERLPDVAAEGVETGLVR